MTENPQRKEDLESSSEKPFDDTENGEEPGAWSEDQKRRGYYYDDACGYEIFDAAAETEDEEN